MWRIAARDRDSGRRGRPSRCLAGDGRRSGAPLALKLSTRISRLYRVETLALQCSAQNYAPECAQAPGLLDFSLDPLHVRFSG